MDMGDGERDDGKDTTTHGLYRQLLNCLLSCRHNSPLSALHIALCSSNLTHSMAICQSWVHVGMGNHLPFSRNQTCISDILPLKLPFDNVGNTYCQPTYPIRVRYLNGNGAYLHRYITVLEL